MEMTINALNIIPAKTASCSVMGDYAIKKKMNVSWAKKKVGDIVLFDFNHNGTSDHTGIVIAINKDGSITTIEGNTSIKSDDNGGNVMKRTRYKSQVNYFVRPKYNSKVTAQMLIDTAKSQLGTKEKPSGSNNVKYNTWYYGHAVKGSAYPWCMTFVCWLFAHVGAATPTVTKPTGKYSGIIPKGLLKVGSKGEKVKQLQAFLNWYHPAWKLAKDGSFGSKTEEAVMIFQKTEGIADDGEYGDKSYAKAIAYKATTPTTPSTPTTTPTTKVIGKCIDVSYWQAKISLDNWKKIKKTCGYAICRASFTSLSKFSLDKDSTFDANVKNAKKAGLKVGAYHFSQALSVSEAQKEANYFCDILDKYDIDFWVACDYETNGKGRLNGKTVSTKASEIANAFCAVVEKRGYKACIYANYTMLTKYLKAPKYPIWLAQYNDTKSYSKNVVLWQYTSKGRVDGITAKNTNNKSANVDLSFVYEVPTYPEKPVEKPVVTPTKPTEPTVTKPTGKYTGILFKHTIQKGYEKPSVGFLQRFLNWYGKYGLVIDNACGEKTVDAMKAFQKAEGLEADGVFGTKSFAKAKTYLNTVHKYRIEVDLTNQICTVFDNDVPIISEFVSTAKKGSTTPTGNFKIQGASGGRKAKLRTAKMSSGKTFAEFLNRFKGAKCMHTVPYKERQTTGHVNEKEFNKLGSVASAGCVRQPYVLAKFIYEKCPVGTPVKVFKGTKGKYPMGKPIKYKATSNIDPTYEG